MPENRGALTQHPRAFEKALEAMAAVGLAEAGSVHPPGNPVWASEQRVVD